MANNYLEFSEVIPHLTAEEEAWLRKQLQCMYVFGNREFTEDELPSDLDAADADWYGCRAWRDLEGCQPDDSEWVGFEYEFNDDDAPDGWGRHLWLYAEESADLERIAHLVQKFLQQFRPPDCWSLTYAAGCSKPRVGEFGGGAVFVTADELKWQNAHDFVEAQSTAFRKKTSPNSTCSEGAIQSYELAIGGLELRTQRGLLLRLREALHQGKRPQLAPDDVEPLEGLINLTDAIADQAADHYGIDCLLPVSEEPGTSDLEDQGRQESERLIQQAEEKPAEDESRDERLVSVEVLAAYENHVWDTTFVEVPMNVAFDDEELSPRAIVDYVEANLADQAQYRHVVAWAFYSFDEDQFQSAEE